MPNPQTESAANAQNCQQETSMNNSKLTILYLRLSVDDGLDKESNSITNQRKILTDYADRNGFVPYITLADDGYSGTNFDRPGWQELISKVENGEAQTIIVKNLDRMGRNYLQNGMYREMFAERGVRLIAINDGIDTAVGEGDDFIPFREIMAEFYARDASRKIKAVLTSKAKSGKPTSNQPPYGFLKDPSDGSKWLVDPEAAAVVKRIYRMAIDGLGVGVIARQLAEEKIDRPSYHLGIRGINLFRDAIDEEKRCIWNSTTIARILSLLEYCGHTVNLKTTRLNFKSKKKQKKPESEWLIFENTHEAIVSQEDFDLVQKLRGTPRRIDTLGEANPLTGLLFCSEVL